MRFTVQLASVDDSR